MGEAKHSFIFIPDISGFSAFVNATEMAHSRHIISELLGVIIDANRLDLAVSEVEGDAVLFYKFQEVPEPRQIVEQAEHMFVAFHSHLRQYDMQRICQCGACSSAPGLTLKMVAHAGELDKISIKGHEKLHGTDLILAHRLLKNDIPSREYVLVTEATNSGHGPEWEDDEWVQKSARYTNFAEVHYRYLSLSNLHKKVIDPPKPASGTRIAHPVIQKLF